MGRTWLAGRPTISSLGIMYRIRLYTNTLTHTHTLYIHVYIESIYNTQMHSFGYPLFRHPSAPNRPVKLRTVWRALHRGRETLYTIYIHKYEISENKQVLFQFYIDAIYIERDIGALTMIRDQILNSITLGIIL